jgi:3-oxoacyl-[acyl-carrier-protein] synthase-3
MADFKFLNVNIKGVYTSVPESFKSIFDIGFEVGLSNDEILKFQAATGVNKLHSSEKITTSDYCIQAAKELLTDLNWSSSSIDSVIFLTQTPDYILPKTSTIIQQKLNLRDDIFVLDINDGCSGFIYGLITAFQFCSPNIKRILLMMGETPSKMVNPKDKSANLLFGDGGSCIAIEYEANEYNQYISSGIDGSGFESIIINDGGFRNITNSNSLKEKIISEGIVRNKLNLQMNGEDVFLFGISRVPKEIKFFLDLHSFSNEDFDFFIMHQANLKMNKMISKKLKVDEKKVLYSINEYGNTSSLSIPLTLTVNSHLLKGKNVKILCSGFGVGLSWGSALLNINDKTIFKNILYV